LGELCSGSADRPVIRAIGRWVGAAPRAGKAVIRAAGGRRWQNGTVKATRPAGATPALAFALAIVVAACGPSAATPPPAPGSMPRPAASASPGRSPSTDLAVFATIEAQAEAIRGLTPAATVTPVLLDSAGLAAKLAAITRAETDHQALANEGALLIHMGLLPAGSDLEQMELDLASGQVIGFYDTKSRGLYVLSGTGKVGAMEKFVFSHEYTHALQDQAFGLDELAIDTPDQGDRDLARTAMVEGDATLLMTLWAAKGLSALELMAIAGQSLNDPSSAQLAKAPAILRETLTFPYDAGLAFVQSVYQAGGWPAVNALYSKPPDSTSQILHPELYTLGVRPVAVSDPAVPASLSGWKLTMADTLGELQLRIWLGTGSDGLSADAAATAVSAWGGDRLALYDGPAGEWAVVLHSTWRSAAGRDEFLAAATTMLGGLGREGRVCGTGTADVEIAIASSEALVPEFIDCNTMG
jgi:hypothetical protein